MTFAQLAVGTRFMFQHESKGLPWPPAVKTGERTFERVWPDGGRSVGIVGVGDNPVTVVRS